MSCVLCRHRPGWSGYSRFTADGPVDVPCRCVTVERDRVLYGSTRNRLWMMQALAEMRLP